MPGLNSLHRLKLGQFADRFRNEMIPLGTRICYFAASVNLSTEDLHDYLDEPLAALPPVVAALLPEVRIFLVPYLEKGVPRKTRAEEPLVVHERPNENQALAAGTVMTSAGAVLGFAVKETEVADYHYRFYRAIAELVAGRAGRGVHPGYVDLIDAEFARNAHGEVDEPSWRLKLDLNDRDRLAGPHRTPAFRRYLRQSFVDTLTLYLHGICCDIDIEPGPRQLASYLLRKRLELLRDSYPPPKGFAVLPEDEA
jgi:hypothetical protein